MARWKSARPRNIFGVPLFSLLENTIADGSVWALDRDKVYAVISSDVGLMIDRWCVRQGWPGRGRHAHR